MTERKLRRPELRARRQAALLEQRVRAADGPVARLQAHVDLLRGAIKHADPAVAAALADQASRYIAGLVATHTASRTGRRPR